VYFHSWIGSENWKEGPGRLGYNRAINREKPCIDKVEAELADAQSFRSLVYNGFQKLLAFRAEEEALGPESSMEIPPGPAGVFGVQRGPDKTGRYALCLMNFRGQEQGVELPRSPVWGAPRRLTLGPWESLWLASGGGRPDARLSSLS
jgi:sucrose phosphorylase